MKKHTFEELKEVFEEIFRGDVMQQIMSCDSKTEMTLSYNEVFSCVKEFVDAVVELSDRTYMKTIGEKNCEVKSAMHKASRILGMVSHHIYHLLEGINLKYIVSKDERDINYRTVAHDIQEYIRFVNAIYNNEHPDTITLHDYIGFSTYIAVETDEHYTGIAIKHLIRECDVDEEIKRLNKIVKKGGAYYYNDMRNELTKNLKELMECGHSKHYYLHKTL